RGGVRVEERRRVHRVRHHGERQVVDAQRLYELVQLQDAVGQQVIDVFQEVALQVVVAGGGPVGGVRGQHGAAGESGLERVRAQVLQQPVDLLGRPVPAEDRRRDLGRPQGPGGVEVDGRQHDGQAGALEAAHLVGGDLDGAQVEDVGEVEAGGGRL